MSTPERRKEGRHRAAIALDAQIGARLHGLRVERGVSQGTLGAALGVTYQQISKYERGLSRVSLSAALRACRALDAPLSALIMEIDMGPESTEALRARLIGQLNALAVSDWAILPRGDVERAFGPAPDWPHLPSGFTVLDEGSERDLLVLREGYAE